MPIPLRLVEEPEWIVAEQRMNIVIQPGDCFFVRHYTEPPDSPESAWAKREFLTAEYYEKWNAIRPPIMVHLPNGAHWCIDSRATDDHGGFAPTGWSVVETAPNTWEIGTQPMISVTPSILAGVGEYGFHAYITDGFITDDLEGRTYAKRRA
jgi:hypothetical protein